MQPIKRIVTLITCLFIINATSSGQVLIALIFGNKLNSDKMAFGLMTGPGFTSLSNSQSKTKTSFNLGMYFTFKLNENFFLHPEIIPKSAFGAKEIPFIPTSSEEVNSLYYSGNVERSIKAISIPLLARYRVYKTIFIEAGPQLDWLTKVKDVYKADAPDGNPITYTKKISSDFNWLSVGLAGGLAWQFKNIPSSMSLGVRYYHGLNDIHTSFDGKQINRGGFVFIYIPIGGNKSEK